MFEFWISGLKEQWHKEYKLTFQESLALLSPINLWMLESPEHIHKEDLRKVSVDGDVGILRTGCYPLKDKAFAAEYWLLTFSSCQQIA